MYAGGLLQGNTLVRTGNSKPVPNTFARHSTLLQTSSVLHFMLLATSLFKDTDCKASHVVVGHVELSIGILPYGKMISCSPPVVNGS